MNDHSKDTMRLIYRLSRDITLVLFSAFIYIIFHIYFDVYDQKNKTGFFCSDKNLWYPYKKSTVPTKVLLVYVNTLLPFVIFMIVESKWNHVRNNGEGIKFYGYNIPLWIPQTYDRIVQYVFGFYLQMSLMLLPKFFDAPQFLRPHFFAVCQPIIGPLNLTCEDVTNPNWFITEYECKNDVNFTKSEVRNIFWTFPSGHTSCSFYTAVYLILYLQQSVRKGIEVKFFLQFSLFILASGISITRLQDHHHHAVDVVTGMLLGAFIAFISHNYLTKFFPQSRKLIGFTNHGIDNNNFEGIDINGQRK